MGRLSQIATFVQVGEEGSLASVARSQGVSPAAISKQITKLEEELGVQLLIRTTRKVEMTEIGRAYFEQCRRILEEIEEADAVLSHMKAAPKGKLKVFSPPHFAARYITPYLTHFLELYPDIELELLIGERMPNFETEEIDLMMGASAQPPLDMIQKKIGTTKYVLCASPSYLEKFGLPISPKDLSKHRCLTHSQRIPPNQFVFAKEDFQFKPYFSVNDTETLRKVALEGMGVVQLHEYVVEKELKEGRLISLLPSYEIQKVPILLAMPPRKYTPLKVRLFIDFMTSK